VFLDITKGLEVFVGQDVVALLNLLDLLVFLFAVRRYLGILFKPLIFVFGAFVELSQRLVVVAHINRLLFFVLDCCKEDLFLLFKLINGTLSL